MRPVDRDGRTHVIDTKMGVSARLLQSRLDPSTACPRRIKQRPMCNNRR